jgi:hypothetical protein
VLNPNQGLYMRLTRNSVGKWWCAQVKSQLSYSFGNFTFFINASIDKLDPNVELRMFIESIDDQTDEISIDIGRQGQTTSSAPNLWYIVYPKTVNGSISSNGAQIQPLGGTYTTHVINWMTDIVTFEAEHDFIDPANITTRFNYYSTNTSWATFVPQTPGYVGISLCTYNGSAPTNGQNVEVNMRQFLWRKN